MFARALWRSGAGRPAVNGLARRMLAVFAAVAIASAAVAQAPKARDTYSLDDLRKAERARDEAQKRLKDLQMRGSAVAREADEIDADLLAAANDSRRREEAAAEAEQRLVMLTDEAGELRRRITADEKGLEDLLAALMTLGSRRPPALAASPEDAGAAVRAAILMGEAAPALQKRAADLKARIAELNAATAAMERERETLNAAESMLAARRGEIEALAAEKRLARTSLAVETAALEAETSRLGREAQTLRDLLDGLAAAAPSAPAKKPPPRKAAATATKPATKPPANPSTNPRPPPAAVASAPRLAGTGPAPQAPVVGKKLRTFGQMVNGERHAGLTLGARSGAQVVAPLDARVEYAGPFRSYGQMLILDVGGDILVVLSGFGALYPEAGQWVLAGEPIGRMADQKSPSPELYLEIRRNGQPVDPEKWLGRGA
jgi:septal ring factor EnvC (AmiA/AmiB activator)